MPPAPAAPEQRPANVPANVPLANDPAAFLEQLKALGLLSNVPANVPPAVPSALPPNSAPMMPPEPARPQKATLGNDPLQALAAMTQAPAMTAPVTPTRPRKTKFVPGRPGQPASGATAHQMMRDPEIIRTLHEKISAWERDNPKRTLMGSHIQQMLPSVSPAQARTIKRLLDKARTRATVADMDGLMQQGAARALMGGDADD